MKIELKKETKASGDVIYFTEIDGNYISDSLSIKEDVAIKIFNDIVDNKAAKKIETIKSIEI